MITQKEIDKIKKWVKRAKMFCTTHWEDGKQKTHNESLLSLKDPFVKDEAALLRSRKIILQKSDFIIPGHGKMFKVEK